MSPKSLLELRTTGFKSPRAEKIHLRCPGCGRKQSNIPRGVHDPAEARLVEINCAECASGDKGQAPAFFDAAGDEVTP